MIPSSWRSSTAASGARPRERRRGARRGSTLDLTDQVQATPTAALAAAGERQDQRRSPHAPVDRAELARGFRRGRRWSRLHPARPFGPVRPRRRAVIAAGREARQCEEPDEQATMRRRLAANGGHAEPAAQQATTSRGPEQCRISHWHRVPPGELHAGPAQPVPAFDARTIRLYEPFLTSGGASSGTTKTLRSRFACPSTA